MPTKNLLEVEITPAIAAVIPLGESELDVYMLGSQEKRLGIEGIGIALGYTNESDFFQGRSTIKLMILQSAIPQPLKLGRS